MSEPSYAVLTGDIVGSTRLSQGALELTRNTVISSANQLTDWKSHLLKSRLLLGGPEFFRGDSWQLLLGDSAMALRAAIYLRASLLSTGVSDMRVSIGIGSVDKIEPKVSLSTGDAFVLSGRGLDEMSRRSCLALQAPTSSGPSADWLRVVTALCDALIAKWTTRQCEILRIAIDPAEPSQEEIAEILAVKRQTVAKTLERMGWAAIEETLATFEATDWRLDAARKQPPEVAS